MIVPKLEEEEPSIVLLETTTLYCLRGKISLGLLCRGGGSIQLPSKSLKSELNRPPSFLNYSISLYFSFCLFVSVTLLLYLVFQHPFPFCPFSPWPTFWVSLSQEKSYRKSPTEEPYQILKPVWGFANPMASSVERNCSDFTDRVGKMKMSEWSAKTKRSRQT